MKNRLKELSTPRTTFKEIAETYGCTISFVGHIAKGRRKPPARFKAVVCEMLNMSENEIFPEPGE